MKTFHQLLNDGRVFEIRANPQPRDGVWRDRAYLIAKHPEGEKFRWTTSHPLNDALEQTVVRLLEAAVENAAQRRETKAILDAMTEEAYRLGMYEPGEK